MRALPAALTLTGQARARKHDTDLSTCRTAQGFGLLGRDAVLTIIGLQNAGKLPGCGAPVRERVIGLAGAGDAGIGGRAAAIKAAGSASQVPADGTPETYDEGSWSCATAWVGQFGRTGPAGMVRASAVPGIKVMAWPAAGYGVPAAGGRRGEEDEQA